MVSLKAPEWREQSIAHHSRAPVDIVAVVDRSESMNGAKLELVKQTLEFVIHQLKDTDCFGIVLYGTQVETLLPPTKMTKHSKALACALVDKIDARGITNLSGGLFQALMDIKDMPTKNAVASVLLFTDGLANSGIRDLGQILRGVNGMMSVIENACTCFTFGFGADHDVNLLKSIADASNAIYYYIRDHAAIADAFADCLGGLLSVCAKALRLRLEAPMKSQVRLAGVHTRFKCVEVVAGTALEITIPDLYSGEERDVLVQLELPRLEQPAPGKAPVLDCELRYTNLIAPHFNRETTTASIARPAVLPAQLPPPNLDMDVQRNRVNASSALDKGRKAADSGGFDEARSVLRAAIDAIRASPSHADPLCRRLIEELSECLADLADKKAYVTAGTQKMATYASSHWNQRSGYTTSPYVTKSKSMMVTSHRSYSASSPRLSSSSALQSEPSAPSSSSSGWDSSLAPPASSAGASSSAAPGSPTRLSAFHAPEAAEQQASGQESRVEDGSSATIDGSLPSSSWTPNATDNGANASLGSIEMQALSSSATATAPEPMDVER